MDGDLLLEWLRPALLIYQIWEPNVYEMITVSILFAYLSSEYCRCLLLTSGTQGPGKGEPGGEDVNLQRSGCSGVSADLQKLLQKPEHGRLSA